MEVGTVAWLRKVLDRFGDEDAQVFISVDDELSPLCGRVDKVLLVYVTEDEPDIQRGETCLCLYPCNCSNEESDVKNSSNTFKNLN